MGAVSRLIEGKQLAFDDPRSKLFFTMVDIINHYKPKYFLLENVKMKKEFQNIITEQLFGVEPVEINSALISAQNRKRLYWFGGKQEDGTYKQIQIEQPQDKGIILADVLQDDAEVDDRMTTVNAKSFALTASYNGAVPWNSVQRKQRTMVAVAQRGRYIDENGKRKDGQGKTKQRIEVLGEKGNAITSVQKDSMVGIVQIPRGFNKGGLHTEKSPTMGSSSWEQNNKLTDGIKIRKLTPIECERLQTVPDNYTAKGIVNGKEVDISNTQRYKMLGNGWTVDVISHIMQYIIK